MKLTTIDPARRQRIAELVAQLAEAKAHATEVTRGALILGHQIGSELIEAHKEAATQATFDALLSGVGLSNAEAAPLVKLAKKYTEDQLSLDFAPAVRQGMFACIVPEKDQAKHEGDARVKLNPGFGTAINQFRRAITQARAGLLKVDREKLKFEAKPVYDYLCDLYAEA